MQRDDAEARINALRANNWQPESLRAATVQPTATDEEGVAAGPDLEELARDQIARALEAKCKGHDLTRLVGAILQAQGYTTCRGPEGADGGADILAGAGPHGFGQSRGRHITRLPGYAGAEVGVMAEPTTPRNETHRVF